jgi:hypothetical protein
MKPEVAALDAALRRAGTDAVLRRQAGNAPDVTNFDVTVRAAVRNYGVEELVGGVAQSDLKAIISPTEILAAGWPVGQTGTMPRRLDRFVLQGSVSTIEAVNPVFIDNELVRIELQIRGAAVTEIPVADEAAAAALIFSDSSNSQYIGQVV